MFGFIPGNAETGRFGSLGDGRNALNLGHSG
jgi:hypothetical protein